MGACSAEGVGGPAGSAGGRFGVRYWAIRFRVAPVFVPPSPPSIWAWILGTQTFRVAGICILPTHTFRVAGVCILPTQTFRVAGVWILYTQTFWVLEGADLPFLKQSIRKMGCIVKQFPRRARGLYHLTHRKMGGTIWRKMAIFKDDN